MKIIASLCVLLVAVLSSRAAGEVRLFIASTQSTNAECVITNSTDKEVYILPTCLVDEAYVFTNYTGSVTNWHSNSSGDYIGQWRDMIPLAPNSSLRFVARHSSDHSWRVRVGVYGKVAHFKDMFASSGDRYEISSEEVQPKTHL
jgi:hypothetical protein